MTDYRVIFEDPNDPEAPAMVLTPTDEWMELAMSGGLPPVGLFLELKEAENAWRKKNGNAVFKHDAAMLKRIDDAPRIGPLTEEEAISYLIIKDVPIHVWGARHNRQMFAIVTKDQIPHNRSFRSAWKIGRNTGDEND